MIDLSRLKALAVGDEDRPDEFDAELDRIISTNDEKVIPELIAFMSDDVHPDLNFSIIHGIESFPIYLYVRGVVGVFDANLPYSDEYMQTIHFRILNSQSCFDEYVKQISTTDKSTKKRFLDFSKKFLDNKDNVQFFDRMNYIISQVRDAPVRSTSKH
jgi:hypothetical protein